MSSNCALKELAALIGESARVDHPLGAMTTYRVGGPAGVFVRLETPADIERVVAGLSQVPVPVLVLGAGSNILVADEGFEGLVVALGPGFADMELSSEIVHAGGAVPLPRLARRSAAYGLTGFEWAVGVPGWLGGAVAMNAGGHGSEMATVIVRCGVVDLCTGHEMVLSSADLELGYRHSGLHPWHVVIWAELALNRGDRAESEALISGIVRWRRENQPGGSNAGSVFKNPPGSSAGHLIEQAGLKGHRIGSAMISCKHANFIQADEGGCAGDVSALIDLAREVVAERAGIVLETEVKMVGFTAEQDRQPAR